jgi:hypothetical protein
MNTNNSHWYDQTFNARGALGGLLIGLGVGIIPAVLLGGSTSWWPIIIAWVICSVIGIILGLIFIKPNYSSTMVQNSDAITYKKFAFFLLIIVLLYVVYGGLSYWLNQKIGLARIIMIPLIGISLWLYNKSGSKKV